MLTATLPKHAYFATNSLISSLFPPHSSVSVLLGITSFDPEGFRSTARLCVIPYKALAHLFPGWIAGSMPSRQTKWQEVVTNPSPTGPIPTNQQSYRKHLPRRCWAGGRLVQFSITTAVADRFSNDAKRSRRGNTHRRDA